MQSGARFAEAVMVLNAHRQGEAPSVRTTRIGLARVFGRLWQELQIPQVVHQLLQGEILSNVVDDVT